MPESILDSTKKALGIDSEYTAFDPDITMYINGVFSTLLQLGVGPEEGFEIADKEATWDDFIGDNKAINSVKTYVYLKVRMLFDPPATSFALDSMSKMAAEIEWRLLVAVDKPVVYLEEGPFAHE